MLWIYSFRISGVFGTLDKYSYLLMPKCKLKLHTYMYVIYSYRSTSETKITQRGN